MNRNNVTRMLLTGALAFFVTVAASTPAAEQPKAVPPDKLQLTQEQLDNMYVQAVMLNRYGRYDDAEAVAIPRAVVE